MTLLTILIYLFCYGIFIFILLPMVLFLAYLLFDLYNKCYLKIVGIGNKWYQNFFIIPVIMFSWRSYFYLRKNLKHGKVKNHIAIVLANNYYPENIASFGLDNVIDLIKYLKKKDRPYRVYNNATSNNIRNIINDKNVKSILLFGHGERHGIKVGRNEVLYYYEFPNHPKKHLIAQFHCNHFNGKSLAEYGNKPIYAFVTNNTQRQMDIERQIKKIIKEGLL